MDYSNDKPMGNHRITNPLMGVEGTVGDYWGGSSAAPQNAFPQSYAPQNAFSQSYAPQNTFLYPNPLFRTSQYLHAERLPWARQSTTYIAPVQWPIIPAPYTPTPQDDLPRIPTKPKGRGVYDRHSPRRSALANSSHSSSQDSGFGAYAKMKSRTRKTAETKKRKLDEEDGVSHDPQQIPQTDGQGVGQGYGMGDGAVAFAGNSRVIINNNCGTNYIVANNGYPLYSYGAQVNNNSPSWNGHVGGDLTSYNQPPAIYSPTGMPADSTAEGTREWDHPAIYQNVHVHHAYGGGAYDNTGMGSSTASGHSSSYGQPPAVQSPARMPDELYNVLEEGAIPFAERLEKQQPEVPGLLSRIDPVLLNSTQTPIGDLASSSSSVPAVSAPPAAAVRISPPPQQESTQMAPAAKRRRKANASCSQEGSDRKSAPIEEGKKGLAQIDALFEESCSGVSEEGFQPPESWRSSRN